MTRLSGKLVSRIMNFTSVFTVWVKTRTASDKPKVPQSIDAILDPKRNSKETKDPEPNTRTVDFEPHFLFVQTPRALEP